jgi:ribosomal-protein-alanine N-acetyltransferase
MIANPDALHPLIRRMNAGDLNRVVEIEQSAYPFPWTRGIFADCIQVGYSCSALQAGARLIGYTIQSQAAGESHLLNLCIEPEWQRKGYGNLLLDHAIRQAGQQRCTSILLEVRPSNQDGIKLYEQKGFVIVGKRPAYYRAADGREDAIIMRLDLVLF